MFLLQPNKYISRTKLCGFVRSEKKDQLSPVTITMHGGLVYLKAVNIVKIVKNVKNAKGEKKNLKWLIF